MKPAPSVFKPVIETLFNGNYVQATAAYNAGPGRPPQWPPDIPLNADQWIETIPFTETREYVQAVLAYTTIYDHKLNADKALRLSDRLQPIMPNAKPARTSNAPRQRGIALLLTLVTAALVVSLAMVILYRQSHHGHVDDYETMEVAWHYVDAMEQYTFFKLNTYFKNKSYFDSNDFDNKLTLQLTDGTGCM